MPVRLIFDRIQHHAEHSGYDQLAKHVHAEPYEDGFLYNLTRRIGSRRLARMSVRQTPWYSAEAQRREIAVCVQSSLWPARTLFHWLYGENDVRICPGWRWRWNNRFVASFHQPAEFLEQAWGDSSYLRGLDGVIVMARSQIPFISRFIPAERIHVVPHGVSTGFWRPAPDTSRRSEPTFLFVGAWLRDLGLARSAILACATSGLPARFRVVVPTDRADAFSGLPGTTVLSRITDSELLAEYRGAHALFLPLSMSTANNSILEAMSCGTGVISTRTGGVPEYVTTDCGELIPPGDVESAIAAIRRVCNNRERVEQIGCAARQRAEDFSWEKVGRLQDDVYLRILGG